MKKIREFFRKNQFIVPCALFAADIVLLIVILNSCGAEKAAQPPVYEPEAWGVEQTVPDMSPNVPDAPYLASTERPTDADFLEWYAKDAMWNGMPQGVDRITDFSLVTGSWKGMIYYDPQSLHGSEAIEMLNFTVGGTASDSTLTADWYSIYYVEDGEGISETDMEDVTFTGSWDSGSLTATGAASVRITDFYTRSGDEKQYAIGEMECADGLYAKVAMVRP